VAIHIGLAEGNSNQAYLAIGFSQFYSPQVAVAENK
jgi:hypothetical protein